MSNNYANLLRLKNEDPAAANRCAERLLAMRKDLKSLAKRKSDGSLLLATWNIRISTRTSSARVRACPRPFTTSRRSSPASTSWRYRRSTGIFRHSSR